MECEICCDETSEKVECPGCIHTVCKACTKRWILETKFMHIECVYCKTQWTNSFIFKTFDRRWIENDFFKHREEVLWSTMKVYLPLYQDQASFYSQYYKLKEDDAELAEDFLSQISDTPTPKKMFLCKCPKDECKGLVYAPGNCAICQISVCPACFEQKEDKHHCNLEIVENVNTLRDETKPCPVCFSPITKIDGCSQMFCTIEGCHSLFDWNTGKVETVGHNPHYYEWMRKTGQALPRRPDARAECGRNGNIYLPSFLKTIGESPAHPVWNTLVHDVEYNILFIVEKLQEKTPVHSPNIYKDCLVDYLIGRSDENETRMLVMKKYTQWEINNELILVLSAYKEMMYDLFWHVQKSFATSRKRDLMKMYDEIITIADRELKNLQKRSGKTTYRFYRGDNVKLLYESDANPKKVVWRTCFELINGRLYEQTRSGKWVFRSLFTEKITYFTTEPDADVKITKRNNDYYLKF